MHQNEPMNQTAFFSFLCLLLAGLMLSIATQASKPGTSLDDIEQTGKPKLTPEAGAEFFFLQNTASSENLIGLAAVMIDLDMVISRQATAFAAFHFDASPFYSFLNRSFQTEMNPDYEIDLHVEELYALWEPAAYFALKAGRRYSGISPVNELHLADFQFNMKPRIFTAYIGDNHGLAIDGLSMKWTLPLGPGRLSWLTEAAKNSFSGKDWVVTAILDWSANEIKNGYSFGIRAFSYFDHQKKTDKHLYNTFHPEELAMLHLQKDMNLNAHGFSVSFAKETAGNRGLYFHAEWMQVRISRRFYSGGFAFVHMALSEKWYAGLMYQQLELPFIEGDQLDRLTEYSITPGLSYKSSPNQRIRLEIGLYENSPFFDQFLLLKYTFVIGP